VLVQNVHPSSIPSQISPSSSHLECKRHTCLVCFRRGREDVANRKEGKQVVLATEVLLHAEAFSTSDLLLMDLEGISILHVERLWVIRRVHTGSVEEESHTAGCLSLTFTEGIHKFLELRCSLDLEEDFVVVIGYFDVQVLACGLLVLVLRRW